MSAGARLSHAAKSEDQRSTPTSPARTTCGSSPVTRVFRHRALEMRCAPSTSPIVRGTNSRPTRWV